MLTRANRSHQVLARPLSPLWAAVIIAFAVFALTASNNAWGVFAGLRLWGDWINSLFGMAGWLDISNHLPSPLLHRVSLLVIATLLGGLLAALVAGQFTLAGANRGDYLRSSIAGLLMGLGATLAGGCTIGGFYMPAVLLSPAGIGMWCGLLTGAVLGLLWLRGDTAKRVGRSSAPGRLTIKLSIENQQMIAAVLFLLLLSWIFSWLFFATDTQLRRVPLLLFGLLVGWVMQRSRFCIASAIREPFFTGDTQMARAVLLCIAFSVPLVFAAVSLGEMDPYRYIPARFWIGSFSGGLFFGVGMTVAGGCATGLLWRCAEGGIKPAVALFFFTWGGSVFSGVLKQWPLLQESMSVELVRVSRLGGQVYLPDALGNTWLAIALVALWLACWWGLIVYVRNNRRQLLR
jgi:uncharacterized membrane protein YedE/YeeE